MAQKQPLAIIEVRLYEDQPPGVKFVSGFDRLTPAWIERIYNTLRTAYSNEVHRRAQRAAKADKMARTPDEMEQARLKEKEDAA